MNYIANYDLWQRENTICSPGRITGFLGLDFLVSRWIRKEKDNYWLRSRQNRMLENRRECGNSGRERSEGEREGRS